METLNFKEVKFTSLRIIQSLLSLNIFLSLQSFQPQPETRQQQQDQLQRRPHHHSHYQPPSAAGSEPWWRWPPRAPAEEAAPSSGPTCNPKHPDHNKLSLHQHRQSLCSVTLTLADGSNSAQLEERKEGEEEAKQLLYGTTHHVPSHWSAGRALFSRGITRWCVKEDEWWWRIVDMWTENRALVMSCMCCRYGQSCCISNSS